MDLDDHESPADSDRPQRCPNCGTAEVHADAYFPYCGERCLERGAEMPILPAAAAAAAPPPPPPAAAAVESLGSRASTPTSTLDDMPVPRCRWSKPDDARLKVTVIALDEKNWKEIAALAFGTGPKAKTDVQCRQRWTKVLAPGIIKGKFTEHEDAIVFQAMRDRGAATGVIKFNWTEVARLVPGRIGKQVSERWRNHLDPTIRTTDVKWTDIEDERIFRAHAEHGTRWSIIAKALPGRTDNTIKNRWNSTLAKSAEKAGGSLAAADALGSNPLDCPMPGFDEMSLKTRATAAWAAIGPTIAVPAVQPVRATSLATSSTSDEHKHQSPRAVARKVTCSYCEALNSAAALKCEACQEPLPASSSAVSAAPATPHAPPKVKRAAKKAAPAKKARAANQPPVHDEFTTTAMLDALSDVPALPTAASSSAQPPPPPESPRSTSSNVSTHSGEADSTLAEDDGERMRYDVSCHTRRELSNANPGLRPSEEWTTEVKLAAHHYHLQHQQQQHQPQHQQLPHPHVAMTPYASPVVSQQATLLSALPPFSSLQAPGTPEAGSYPRGGGAFSSPGHSPCASPASSADKRARNEVADSFLLLTPRGGSAKSSPPPRNHPHIMRESHKRPVGQDLAFLRDDQTPPTSGGGGASPTKKPRLERLAAQLTPAHSATRSCRCGAPLAAVTPSTSMSMLGLHTPVCGGHGFGLCPSCAQGGTPSGMHASARPATQTAPKSLSGRFAAMAAADPSAPKAAIAAIAPVAGGDVFSFSQAHDTDQQNALYRHSPTPLPASLVGALAGDFPMSSSEPGVAAAATAAFSLLRDPLCNSATVVTQAAAFQQLLVDQMQQNENERAVRAKFQPKPARTPRKLQAGGKAKPQGKGQTTPLLARPVTPLRGVLQAIDASPNRPHRQL